MQGFSGFPRKSKNTTIPNPFFSDLLPIIDHLGEMKVTLYCMWALQKQEGKYRYARLGEMLDDTLFLEGLGKNHDEQVAYLHESLERAVARGTLLHVTLKMLGYDEEVYFMNSPNGQLALKAIEKGDWYPGDAKRPIELIVERPNIFVVYEQNIGAITTHIAEQLRQAETEYPQEWIIEAIHLATENNANNWRYIAAILERWHREGKTNGTAQKRAQQTPPNNDDIPDYIER
jgi:DNA replication protein